MNSLEKWRILTPFQKLPNNVGDLGKIIVAPSFECLPKEQKIAKSGHTVHEHWWPITANRVGVRILNNCFLQHFDLTIRTTALSSDSIPLNFPCMLESVHEFETFLSC